MNQKRLIVAAIIIILGLLYFPLHSYLQHRDIKRLALVIVNNWKNDNLTGNYVYWKDPAQSPPIYGLDSYKILKSHFEKKGNISSAQVSLYLDFPPDNLMPSGKVWILEFYKFPRLGWLVVDFRQESP